MRALWRNVILGTLLLGPCSVVAQYYDLGQSPASIRWKQIRTSWNRLVFPENYQGQAIRLMKYLDTIRPIIGYGFRYGPMRMPVVMHTQNFSSNGLVMWAPKRMELIVPPNIETFAEPWLKQLATHEYRHSVQFNNTNRHFIRGLSYVIGQQGSLIGAALLPLWLMEGDAVMAETELASFGRGLQPSFSIDYRGLAGEKSDFLREHPDGKITGREYRRAVAEGLPVNRWDRFAIDKWFCGSYKDYIPDHYHVGYQIATYSFTRYGENIWDKVADYGSRYPFLIFTTKIALHRNYRTSTNKLFRAAFDDLERFWDSLPSRQDNTRIIATPRTSFTTYSSPIPSAPHTLVALKSDLDRYSRIVEIDTRTGTERTIRHTGVVSTPLTMSRGRLLWTEYRPSTLWDQRVNSQLCYLDLATGKSGVVRGERRVLFPVSLPGGEVARVEYNYDGTYTIRGKKLACRLPDTISVHGLAWDDVTARLYFIGLSDGGMWIGSVDDSAEGFSVVKSPAYSTLSNLRAAGGKLYFGSIQSGRDEAHLYDLVTNREYRITSSRYGSFSPAPFPGGGSVATTTYTPQGYLVATRTVRADSLVRVEDPRPRSVVNPSRRHWEVDFDIDSVQVDTTSGVEIRRFRKAANMFNVHSWAPLGFDPDGVVGEQSLNIHLGASLISQSLLNSTFAHLMYAWTEKGSLLAGRIRYYGLAPKIEVEAHYGGGDQLAYLPTIITSVPGDPDTSPDNSSGSEQIPTPPGIHRPSVVLPTVPALKDYFDVSLRLFMPILLDAGYHVRYLTPDVELSHNNALLYDPIGKDYDHGMQKLSVSLQYIDNVRMAHRDFLPRWGYAVRLSSVSDPFNKNFGKLWSAYVRGYLPGVVLHHSLRLRAAYQYQHAGIYNYRQKEVYPRGANYDIAPRRYLGTSIDYQFPLCYPDGGISSIVYFKRIRLNLIGDYARYQNHQGRMGNVYSYGGELIFDLNLLRTPSPATTAFGLSLYKPSDRKGCVFGVNLAIPL